MAKDTAFKKLGKALEDAVEQADPAMRRFFETVDRATEMGRERYEERRRQLEERRRAIDEELDRRFR